MLLITMPEKDFCQEGGGGGGPSNNYIKDEQKKNEKNENFPKSAGIWMYFSCDDSTD